jgi:hypothetical protein
VATPAADFCNYGVGAGKSNYQIDYSTATGAGITTATPSTLASSTGISNIMYADASNSHMMLRSDVDVDVIASNGYPRTEGRERQQDGTTLRAFNPLTGAHWVECWELPTHLPPMKPSYVMLQMHDASGDIIEIAIQPRSDFATTGLLEIVARINGSSRVQIGLESDGITPIYYTWPKLVTTHVWGKWYRCRIYVGAIHSGSTGYEISVNSVTVKDTDNVDMPAMSTSGANSYFKCGMYLQTKWTGSGTGGLETDRSEYGEAGFRDFRTSHNGETDTSVQVRGTSSPDTVSNVRWGTKAAGRQTTASSGISLTPTLPASLADGDMMGCIIRASRAETSSTAPTSALPFQSVPTSPSIATGWTKMVSIKAVTTEATTGAYAGGPQLAAHNVRWMLYVRKWVSGDAAPNVVYATGTTTTDTMSTQVFACSNAKLALAIEEFMDQLPAGLTIEPTNDPTSNSNITGITYASSTSTTAIGPTGATAGTPLPGSLAIACVTHETNATSGSIATVSGGTDSLTWAAGGSAATTTTTTGSDGKVAEDEPAWGNDWAIVPTSGYNQAIPAKTAAGTISNDANKPNTGTVIAGKGWGVAFTIAPARKHRRWLRAAS